MYIATGLYTTRWISNTLPQNEYKSSDEFLSIKCKEMIKIIFDAMFQNTDKVSDAWQNIAISSELIFI